ncbi:MAG: hypothetical protein K2X93_25935 [Candidatus Obscuribacterales bacterium]|nr:hypothetical protein [Candidatus Obscuribacterales bacterium]
MTTLNFSALNPYAPGNSETQDQSTPEFAVVPEHPFSEKLRRRESDNITTNTCNHASIAVPTSLSIDDSSVKLTLSRMSAKQRPPRTAKTTLVDAPSVKDAALINRRLAQLDQVMFDLEDSKNFWNRPELLLHDSWLNGYRGTFFEQKNDFVRAIDSYKRGLKLYALALKLDKMTAKSSPHIVSFYFLLKRFANALSHERLPENLRDDKAVRQIHEQMQLIRRDRERWGMPDPETEDEPFAYASTILRVLC